MIDPKHKHAFTAIGLLALTYVVAVVTLNVVVIRDRLRDSFADTCADNGMRHAPLFVQGINAYGCWKPYAASEDKCTPGPANQRAQLTTWDVSETMPSKKCLYVTTPDYTNQA
jgi:hypothetical protein